MTRVTKIGNKNWEVEINLYQRANMRLNDVANSTEYRINELFQNSAIFGAKFWFSKLEKFGNLSIF